MLVMDAITEILKREGISTLFSFPTTPIIEAAVAGGMRPVICRQERVGVHMADGCARVTNGNPPGVFAMQYGPGAENAFAGIASAYSDSTPILLLPLGHPRETAQMFPLFNSTRTYATVTKHVEPVLLPEHTLPAMRRAFNALKNGRPGPVMVEVPADVMTAEFAGNEVDYTAVRRTRSAGDPRDIDDAIKMLIEAKSPIIIAGQGVLYAEASAELVRLAPPQIPARLFRDIERQQLVARAAGIMGDDRVLGRDHAHEFRHHEIRIDRPFLRAPLGFPAAEPFAFQLVDLLLRAA